MKFIIKTNMKKYNVMCEGVEIESSELGVSLRNRKKRSRMVARMVRMAMTFLSKC